MSDGVRFEQLQHAHFHLYMNSFSMVVQNILHVHSPESEVAYLTSRLRYHELIEPICFIVALDVFSNTILGALELRPPHSSVGQLYCWVHESLWGTGLFAQMFQCGLTHYYSLYNNSHITARVCEHNPRSKRALEKLGFVCTHTIAGAEQLYHLEYKI